MSKDDLIAAAQKFGEHLDSCGICQKSDMSVCPKGMYLLKSFYTELQTMFNNKDSPKKGEQ